MESMRLDFDDFNVNAYMDWKFIETFLKTYDIKKNECDK